MTEKKAAKPVAKKPVEKKEPVKKVEEKEPEQFAHPKGHVKCVNCEVFLPKHTEVCENCGYRQP